MNGVLDEKALELIFTGARTFNKYLEREVSDETLKAVRELMKWGPTAVNCQPARFVFVKSKEAKKRLIPALSPGNVAKVESAPVTVIVAVDTEFYEKLPGQWTAYDASGAYRDDKALAETTGLRNGSLQGAYLIVAARALGLDCGPMSGFDNAKLDKEFFPDGKFRSNFLVNLGYGEPGGFYPRGPRLDFETSSSIL
ncbi:MAG: malonic semialdehyde reductase [Deltaproteobacteria bacterium]|jgi:3-hydroxypropanoate dehydrogenase|nr:malonic semialdehyde reductase [Deltaproteobacteria bacterium]